MTSCFLSSSSVGNMLHHRRFASNRASPKRSVEQKIFTWVKQTLLVFKESRPFCNSVPINRANNGADWCEWNHCTCDMMWTLLTYAEHKSLAFYLNSVPLSCLPCSSFSKEKLQKKQGTSSSASQRPSSTKWQNNKLNSTVCPSKDPVLDGGCFALNSCDCSRQLRRIQRLM